MTEGQSLKFRFCRTALTMLSSVAAPFAFGLALTHVPFWVRVFMFVAAALHFGEYLFALWAREKDAVTRSQSPDAGKVLFVGDDARRLNEFVHNLANKHQRPDLQ